MDRQLIIERLHQTPSGQPYSDQQLLALLSDSQYPDISIRRWLELKVDYMSLLMEKKIITRDMIK